MYGERTKKYIGEFECGEKLFASDPCYQRVDETDLSSAVISVVPGTWKSSAILSDEGSWGDRVAELYAYSKYWEDDGYMNPWNWEFYSSCGVDSGQLGFFDYEKYPIGVNGYEADYEDESNWYKRACNETYNEKKHDKRFGIVENMGVNSSSGFGDGCYDIFVARNNDDEVIAVKSVFIPEDEDRDD